MLLRRRLTGLDSILGPNYEGAPPAGGAPAGGDPAASGAAGGAGGAPTGTGSPPAPPTPGTGQPPADDRSGWIPRDRFDEVNGRLKTLETEKQQRETADLTAKGEHQKVAEREKARADTAEERATRIARRAAFIAKASGKVADPEAAFKLAFADGDLNDLEVDDDGNAKDPKAVEKIVDELVKRYEFLKSTKGERSFGAASDGNGSGQPVDTSKMSSRDMLSAGYAGSKVGSPGSGFRQRQE